MGNIVGYLFVIVIIGLGIFALVPAHWLPGFWSRLGRQNEIAAPKMRDLPASKDDEDDLDMFKPGHDWSKMWNDPDSNFFGSTGHK